ncbi:hypothetical protein AMATHDRAFT_60439 [Amanita thiersii Skay4041]|uniref:Small ribosomal subunit protein mS35 mitochondrial conserved domain-containing protein n=1 Tax=Amanita thiersii Skay4041 TaxID=703135 RepID=A0A2A9NJM1_9AGAR|nr:hypothetical protein AMATHDRAFT_60439 [Amanita thiersii Skay4041]
MAALPFARLARTVSRPRPTFSPRHFSTSSPALARRSKLDEVFSHDQAFELLDDDFDGDDTTSAGHLMLRDQRETLYYLRLIEHEMPKLVAFRRPFKPPTSDTPIVVRSITYAGEEHPAAAKRVIVVPVDQLPLKDNDAIHKLKLLAGPRWTPNPPADAGVSDIELWGNGYIKISCEDFPKPAQNLKWASDTLDRLIMEANSSKGDKFRDVPLDMRHVYAKVRKAKKGDHRNNQVLSRPSILDFPKEWLPPRTPDTVS